MEGRGVRHPVSGSGRSRKLAAVLMAVAVIVFTGMLAGTAQALPPGCRPRPDGRIDCGGSEEDPRNPGPDRPGPRVPRPHDIYYTPACPYNGPPPNDPSVMCESAVRTCELRGQDGILMRIYYQWEPGGPWELQATRCVGGAQEDELQVDPGRVRLELVTRYLPAANVAVNPGNGRTLLNFPTIFYTEVGPYRETVTILGQPVTIEAEPVAFLWTWGDGQTARTTTPGRPYSPSADPSEYVTHEYTVARATPYPVDVDVEWRASFSVGGGPQQDLGTLTVTRGETASVTVLEKADVLSGS